MLENKGGGLFFTIGIDAQGLIDGLQKAAEQLNGFEQRLRNANAPISEIAQRYTSAGLVMGNVSDEVAQEILKIGTTSQQAALVTGRAFDGIQKKLGAFSAIAKSVLAPIAAAFAGTQLVSNFSQLGEELAVISDRTGVAVEKIDSWAKANKDAGGSAEAFKSALEQWTIETGRGADEFFKLGEHVKGMTDVQARYFMRTMGLSQEASAIFIKHKDSADQVAKSYEKMAFTREQAESARRMNILWRQFTNQAQSLGNMLLLTVLPVVNDVLEALSDGIQFLKDHSQGVKMILAGLAAVIGGAYLRNVLKLVGGFATFFKTIRTGTGIMAALNAVMLANPIGVLVAAVTALALAFDDFFVFLDGGHSLLGDFLAWCGLSEKSINGLRKSWGNAFNALIGLPGKLIDGIKAVFSWFGAIDDAVTETVGGTFDLLAQLPRAIVEGIPQAFQWLKDRLTGFLGDIGSAITGFFSDEDDDENGADQTEKARRGTGRPAKPRAQAQGFTAVAPQHADRPAAAGSLPQTAAAADGAEGKTVTDNVFNRIVSIQPMPVARDMIGQIATPQMPVATPYVAAKAQRESAEGVRNDMRINVENHITTSADPQAVGQAVTNGVDTALARRNRMLVNMQTGVVQKG